MMRYYLSHKIGFGGKTTRQELLRLFHCPAKGVFMLRQRYLKEVVRIQKNLGVFRVFVPHTDEYTLSKSDFLSIARYEIPGIVKDAGALPEIVVLLREPTYGELSSYSIDYFQRYYWSLLFHSEIHKLQMHWEQQKRLSDMDVSLFLESLRADVWDEIKTVLAQQNLVFDTEDIREILYEFIAYYLQFYNFAPQSLPKFFPLLPDPAKVHAQILGLGIDETVLLEKSRPPAYMSTEDLIFLRDNQIEDPDHDLDLFKPGYYIEKIYNSPAVSQFDLTREQFKAKYGGFIVNKLLGIVIVNSRLIGQLTFEDLIDRARLEGVDWDAEKLLIFDKILSDGLYTLYRKASRWDHLLVRLRGVVCLHDIRYQAKKARVAKNSITAMKKRKTKVEQRKKRSRLKYLLLWPVLFPFKLLEFLWKAVTWLPKSIAYLMAESLEPYFLWAQRIADIKRRKKFSANWNKAIVCGNRGNIVGAVIYHKETLALAQKIYRRIDAAEEDQQLYKALETDLEHKLSHIEEKFSHEHRLSPQARHHLQRLFQYLKDVDHLQSVHKRLLQDIQKSYIDPNKEFFRISFLKCIGSFGKYPLKEPIKALPVKKKLMALQSIEKRLYKLQVREKELKHFQFVIKQALESVETELRTKLGAWIDESMRRSQITPARFDTSETSNGGHPAEVQQERIAYEKIKEDLVDIVVEKGHLKFSDLRDAISCNDLKLNDLTGLHDPLLTFDKNVGRALSGIHRPAEVYMKAIHRLNSLLFGTASGRWMCKYIFLPFGGAYLFLELICVILHIFHVPEQILLDPVRSFYPWIVLYCERILDDIQPVLPIFKAIELKWGAVSAGCGFAFPSYRSLLDHAIFVLFKITWSFTGGVFLLFIIYTAIGRTIWDIAWRGIWKIVKFVLIDTPTSIWFFPAVQFVYKLRLWVYINIFIVRPFFYSLFLTIPLLKFTEITGAVALQWVVLGGIALANLFVNTSLGRGLVDYVEEVGYAVILRINATLFLGLFQFIMETFRVLVKWVEQLLYSVDDFFRFRQGDNIFIHMVKAVFGNTWYAFNYITRFSINLIIEPQVNPIKHFPVVTIAHKILLPISIVISKSSEELLKARLGDGMALAGAMTVIFFFVQFGIPGICGFITWELRENWKLYRHARSRYVKRVIVGSHGEDISRLLRPGFHSGTIPKLYRKMRESAEFFYRTGNRAPMRKQEYRHHHICQEITRFTRRCLKAEFDNNSRIVHHISHLEVKKVGIYNCKIAIPFTMQVKDLGEVAFGIHYELKNGLICASLALPDPLPALPREVIQYLNFAIAVFCKKSSVDLVEGQVLHYFNHTLAIDTEQYRFQCTIKWPRLSVCLRPRWDLSTSVHVDFDLSYPQVQPTIVKFLPNRIPETKSVLRNHLVFWYARISWIVYNRAMAGYAQNGIPIPEELGLPVWPENTRL